jgi:hypothetical protein
VQGVNLRDHYNGNFNDIISRNTMSRYWGTSNNVRLDCQGWMLPAAFYSQALTNIQIKSFGNYPDGVPFLAAITIRTTGPVMTISQIGNQAVCSWPSTPTNYVLQTTASLENQDWITTTNLPVIIGNHFVVTNLTAMTNQFYHLLAVP